MHIQHAGLETTWKQELGERHYCQVFIWDTSESLWKAFDKHDYLRREHDYCGRCTGSIWIKRNGKHITAPKFSEIHLVRNEIGAGYVAHEIQHLVNYWSHFMNWKRTKNDEKIAHFCGEFTRDFWVNFYDRYSHAS